MRTNRMALVLAMTAAACATIDVPDTKWRRDQAPASAGTDGDACAPGNAARFEDAPDAVCALKTDPHVPDLTTASSRAPRGDDGSGTGTRTLRPLAGPNASAPSCDGRVGPGHTTCGANGDDSCCRTATVPPGTAGAQIAVANAFDLGVYQVTAARLRAFVDAFDGDLRGAAAGGALPGYDPANADRLPASRGAADTELGPACEFRGDPRDYGSRTWWSKDVEDAVASIMTDDNARAADIRADATKPRLDAKPANCVSYWMAAAFCAWDGGRLPSNDEWTYAALGGDELRAYPWGDGRTAERLVTDINQTQNGGAGDPAFTWPNDFPFFANGMNAYHLSPPGRKPAGVARWGHHDMAGNVLEWMSDVLGPDAGIVRGGSWEGHSDANAASYVGYPLTRTYGSVGFRCAYGAAQPAAVVDPEPAAPATVPVYLAHNPQARDHLLTLTPEEGAPAWITIGVQFVAFAGAPADMETQAPLYRCRKRTGHHFVSNHESCEGAGVNEGLLGTAHRGQLPGTAPIYRCYAGNDHLTTLRPAECDAAGMTIEGTQGFVFPPAP